MGEAMRMSATDLMRHWATVGRHLLAMHSPQAHHGHKTITNNSVAKAVPLAADLSLKTNSDYVQVTGIFDASSAGNHGITAGTNSLTVTRTGTYMILAWSSITSTTSNVNLSFRFGVNGVIPMSRRNWARLGAAGDRVGFSAHGYIDLTAGDTLTVWIAADKASNVVIEDGVFTLQEVAG